MIAGIAAAHAKIKPILEAAQNEAIRIVEAKLAKDYNDDARATAISNAVTLQILASLEDLEPELTDINVDAAREILAQAGVDLSSDIVNQVNQRAVAYARARAAELVTMIDDSTRDELRTTIADGLASGMTSDEIAQAIQDSYTFSERRSTLIAETEIGLANGQGSLQGMKQAQAAGVELLKEWLTDPDPCPICIENGDEGPIPLDAVFPSGDDAPYAHPNCRCVLITVKVEKEEQ